MTIYDIAKEAGVSASTVSRVMNGKPGISEATRKKVEKLLSDHNFTPDASAQGLVTQASRFVGILIEDIRVSHHTESVYVIEQEMTRRGYTCITFSTGPDPTIKARYIQILEQRRVEGAILIGSMFGTDEVKKSIAEHLRSIPVVIINGEIDLPNTYSVLIDEERGTEDCVSMLKAGGRRHLGYLMDVRTPANEKKEQGFFTGMFRAGLGHAEPCVFSGFEKTEVNRDQTSTSAGTDQEDTSFVTMTGQNIGTGASPRDAIERGRRATVALLSSMPDVDGILCATDLVAIGCLQELTERGIKVPEQIAVVGVDNTLYGELCTPKLTSLDNKLSEVSLSGARILLDALERKPVSHKMMLFTEIRVREST
jgi:LacI family transcriptional regulator